MLTTLLSNSVGFAMDAKIVELDFPSLRTLAHKYGCSLHVEYTKQLAAVQNYYKGLSDESSRLKPMLDADLLRLTTDPILDNTTLEHEIPEQVLHDDAQLNDAELESITQALRKADSMSTFVEFINKAFVVNANTNVVTRMFSVPQTLNTEHQVPPVVQLRCVKRHSTPTESETPEIVWPSGTNVALNGGCLASARSHAPVKLDVTQSHVNVIRIVFEPCDGVYVFAIVFAIPYTLSELVQSIRTNHLTAQWTKERFMDLFHGKGAAVAQEQDQDEIEVITTSKSLSLRDPYTLERIRLPARSTTCAHIGVFDLNVFVESHKHNLQIQHTCPFRGCRAQITKSTLYVDTVVLDWLDAYPESVYPELDNLTILQDGTVEPPEEPGAFTTSASRTSPGTSRNLMDVHTDQTIVSDATSFNVNAQSAAQETREIVDAQVALAESEPTALESSQQVVYDVESDEDSDVVPATGQPLEQNTQTVVYDVESDEDSDVIAITSSSAQRSSSLSTNNVQRPANATARINDVALGEDRDDAQVRQVAATSAEPVVVDYRRGLDDDLIRKLNRNSKFLWTRDNTLRAMSTGELAARGSFEIKPSFLPGAGLGLFSTRRIEQNVRLGAYTGECLVQPPDRAAYYILKATHNAACRFIDGDYRRYPDKASVFSLINTSPEGHNNVKFTNKGNVVTRRVIEPGEEFYVDYGDEYVLPL